MALILPHHNRIHRPIASRLSFQLAQTGQPSCVGTDRIDGLGSITYFRRRFDSRHGGKFGHGGCAGRGHVGRRAGHFQRQQLPERPIKDVHINVAEGEKARQRRCIHTGLFSRAKQRRKPRQKPGKAHSQRHTAQRRRRRWRHGRGRVRGRCRRDELRL